MSIRVKESYLVPLKFHNGNALIVMDCWGLYNEKTGKRWIYKCKKEFVHHNIDDFRYGYKMMKMMDILTSWFKCTYTEIKNTNKKHFVVPMTRENILQVSGNFGLGDKTTELLWRDYFPVKELHKHKMMQELVK